MPITSPKPDATTALAVTMTQRAGWAMTAFGEGAVLHLGREHQRADDRRPASVVSHVEKMNVWLIVKTSSVFGSVLTNVARIHDSRTPMTTVTARMTGVERRERSLIHSLRMAAGHGGEVVAPRCGWCVGAVVVEGRGGWRWRCSWWIGPS